MLNRRGFLEKAGAWSAAGLATFRPEGLERLYEATAGVAQANPADVARDETYWREVQQAFTLDRSLINLNNGGCCPSPRIVHESFKRYLDISNQAPVYHMWQILEPNLDGVRRQLAADAGLADMETLAITRNASESLQIAQLGLDMKPGDEVLTTNQDYGRMLQTWDQRVERDGISVRKITFPVPANSADLIKRFTDAVTPKTKVIHFCHITNLTGQIFPVKEICAMARGRGITTIVDGAHAYAQFPFKLDDFGCDFYGTSLHKWLLAPIGTGFLYVRRDRIKSTWALQPAPASMADNIRKFEEIGTHPAATHNAIAEAIVFHRGIGVERKAARLRYLRDRWATRLKSQPRFRIHTPLNDPTLACAIGTVGIDGMKPGDITSALWAKWRIIATPIDVKDEYNGIRVTPNVYTTLDEVDTFASAMETIAKT